MKQTCCLAGNIQNVVPERSARRGRRRPCIAEAAAKKHEEEASMDQHRQATVREPGGRGAREARSDERDLCPVHLLDCATAAAANTALEHIASLSVSRWRPEHFVTDFSSTCSSRSVTLLIFFEIKVKIQEEIDEVGQMAHNMKEKLNKIFQSALTPILNNLSKGRGYPVTLPKTMDPSAMSMTMELKIKLKEKENDFKNLRKTVWEEYVEVVQRRTFTVTGIKLSDEVVHMITASNIVQMFENALQGINPEQVVPAMMDEIKERHAAAMDLDKKILELQQNFAEMGALLESREKMDKALNKVRKLTVRGQSTQKELRKEMAENDRLLEENGRLFTLVISLGISLCMIAIILLLQV